MKQLYNRIDFLEVRRILEDLNVNSLNSDILFHGSTLYDYNYEEVTREIFEKGVSKKTKSVAPFMSILATAALLSDKYDTPSQIIDYNLGNVSFIIRIPKEYEGVHFGKIDQKYARRTSGLQDESVCALDLLEIEAIPSEFIVGCIKKSNDEYGKFDLLINPRYFELDKSKSLKNAIEEVIDNSSACKMTKIVVKHYMNIEKVDEEIYKGCLDFLSTFKRDSNFIQSLTSKGNKR